MKRVTMLIGAAVLATLLAACGSSSGAQSSGAAPKSNTSSSTASGSGGASTTSSICTVSGAKQVLTASEKAASVPVSHVHVPVPKDKTIFILETNTNSPTVTATTSELTKIDTMLGWKTITYNAKGTTQGFVAGLKQALAENVSAVQINSTPASQTGGGVAALRAKGIPVISSISGNVPSPTGVSAEVNWNSKQEGTVLAAAAIAAADGHPEPIMLSNTQFPTVLPEQNVFEADMKTCGVKILANQQFSIATMPTQIPPLVSSMALGNPSANVLYLSFQSTAPYALQGLDNAKAQDRLNVIAPFCGSQDVANMTSGKTAPQYACLLTANRMAAWVSADDFLLLFDHKSLDPADQHIAAITAIRGHTAGFAQNWAENALHYQEIFKKDWGLS